MNVRLKIYHLLVNGNPVIRQKYQRLRKTYQGAGGRLYSWAALPFLWMQEILLPTKSKGELFNERDCKAVPEGKCESQLTKREPVQQLMHKLLAYDVISFDIFDTLLFRPFASPANVFYLVGKKLGYLDFARIRVEMEVLARVQKQSEGKTSEVTLKDIYTCMEIHTGISCEQGMRAERETELEICYANPYFTSLFEELVKRKKTIIAVSDMYLSEELIRRMLEKCGFKGFHTIFVSCERGAGKWNGALFSLVKESMGDGKRYVHIGDHPEADVKQAKAKGFDAIYYQNVNEAGDCYRTKEMSVITGSMYRGIVNAHIHSGVRKFGQEYEMGFVYGGLFVFGYCRFIHDYAKQNGIDKILFLSRDGEIIYKVYQMLYPKEANLEKTEYIYWSRLAAVKMGAKYDRYDFFRRFLYHKVNQGYPLTKVFDSMGLDDMLEGCIRETGGSWVPQDFLTEKKAEKIRQYLLARWDIVLSHYEEETKAAALYFKQCLRGCKKAAAIDIGWAGSGALTLRKLVKEEWQLPCDIVGILAGTNSIYNAEPDMSEAFLFDETLVSYLYSQSHNRNLWKWHDPSKGHNLLLELFVSSAEGSFKRFEQDLDGNILIHKKEPDVDPYLVSEMQSGIMEFAIQAKQAFGAWGDSVEISGSDAYAPIKLLAEKQNKLQQWIEYHITPDI